MNSGYKAVQQIQQLVTMCHQGKIHLSCHQLKVFWRETGESERRRTREGRWNKRGERDQGSEGGWREERARGKEGGGLRTREDRYVVNLAIIIIMESTEPTTKFAIAE